MQVGVTGTLIGVVIILQNMSDPNAIGPAMAVALLVPLYCLIIKGITFNFAKVMNIPATEPSTSMSWLGILILTVVLISPMATSVGLAAFIDLTSIVIILIAISIVVAISYINNKEHVLDNIAKTLPLIGFVGFFIGLIGMLQNINDPKSIGPAMAVALLTTFYGAVLANAVALPIKNKIEYRSKREIIKMEIVIAGTLGIVAGENPRLIKEKLSAFLPPAQRVAEAEEE